MIIQKKTILVMASFVAGASLAAALQVGSMQMSHAQSDQAAQSHKDLSQADLFTVKLAVGVPVVGTLQQLVHLSLETDASGLIRKLNYRVEMNSAFLDKAVRTATGENDKASSDSSSRMPKYVHSDVGKSLNTHYTGSKDLREILSRPSAEPVDLEFAKAIFDSKFTADQGGKLDLTFTVDREKNTPGKISLYIKPKSETSKGEFEIYFVNRVTKWQKFTVLYLDATAKPDLSQIFDAESGGIQDSLSLEVSKVTFTGLESPAVSYSSKELAVSL